MESIIAQKLFDYNPRTGIVLWKPRVAEDFSVRRFAEHWNKRYAGREAGYIASNGYRYINVKGKMQTAHRLAWLIYYGKYPAHEIDHINGDKADNRISNLREATHQQNMCNQKAQKNSATGVKGVSREGCKFRTRIMVNGKRHNLGIHDTIEQAKEAYEKASKELHGEYGATK